MREREQTAATAWIAIQYLTPAHYFNHYRKMRSWPGQWLSEAVAAFGFVLTILLTLRANQGAVATSVGLCITAAYWFTASTSFANPAVTIARAFSNTFAGIGLADAGPFIAAQLLGAVVAMLVCRTLLPCQPPGDQ